MFVKIRMRSKSVDHALPQGYPIRPYSFIYSVGVHFVVIALLAVASSIPGPSARPVYDELIRPTEHRIIFYDLQKALPDVAPLEKVGRSALPRGTKISIQTIIATSPKPISRTQSIFVPAPKIERPQDVPVPDLVARNATSLPTLAPPPKPAPIPPKVFVPPPINRQPKLPVQLPAVDAVAPSINSLAAPAPSLAVTGISAISRIAAPRPDAPPVPTATNGNANVDAAIANLDPSKNTNRTLPEGERPGQFSKAPNRGPAATGEVAPATLTVPNLSIRESGGKAVKVPEDKPAVKTILYEERVRNTPHSTLSVPLRSASRTIPAAVDARFRGRNVYAIVIPIENMPAYGGDWIVWFAEREPPSSETPLIYAPIPFRKVEAIEEAATGNRLRQRIQVAAIMSKAGQLNDIALVTNAAPAVERAAIQDVASWEFKPATRNGIPIDVDVVIEIPFNLALPVVSSPSP
jgi:hypothetical protein